MCTNLVLVICASVFGNVACVEECWHEADVYVKTAWGNDYIMMSKWEFAVDSKRERGKAELWNMSGYIYIYLYVKEN